MYYMGNYFGGDSVMYRVGSDYAELQHNLQTNAPPIGNDSSEINLTVNVKINGSMITGTNQRRICEPDIEINIHDSALLNLLNHDCLGVTVKYTLSWDLHMHKLIKYVIS